MTPTLPRELAPRRYSSPEQHVRERQDGLTGAGGEARRAAGEEEARQSIREVVSTLSHDLTIGQDDERTAIREADMPPPLEIERASQAGRSRRCQN